MTDQDMRDPFAFAREGKLAALIAEERRLEAAAAEAYADDDVPRAEDLTDRSIGIHAKLRAWRPNSVAELIALIDYWRAQERDSRRVPEHIVIALRELTERRSRS